MSSLCDEKALPLTCRSFYPLPAPAAARGGLCISGEGCDERQARSCGVLVLVFGADAASGEMTGRGQGVTGWGHQVATGC